VIEFQLGTSTVSGGAPYLIHHVERVSGLVETALEIGKSVCVRKFFIINLDWSCVGSILCHNFGVLAANVKANFLFKGVKGTQSAGAHAH